MYLWNFFYIHDMLVNYMNYKCNSIHLYYWMFSEILGALLSVFTIWLVTGVLVYLAVERLIDDDFTIEGTVMLITAGCAVLANIM